MESYVIRRVAALVVRKAVEDALYPSFAERRELVRADAEGFIRRAAEGGEEALWFEVVDVDPRAVHKVLRLLREEADAVKPVRLPGRLECRFWRKVGELLLTGQFSFVARAAEEVVREAIRHKLQEVLKSVGGDTRCTSGDATVVQSGVSGSARVAS